MNRLIAAITGFHVLLHGVFGCCNLGLAAPAHKSHSCPCHHVADGDHAEHSHGGDAEDRDSPPREPHMCVHASCHWLVGDAVSTLSLLDFQGATFIAAIVPPSTSASSVIGAGSWCDVGAARSLALPVRLHLAVGVLLI
jgi:hypothetical protein